MLIRIVILGVILAGFLRAQAVLEPPMGMKWGDSPEHLIEWANRHQLDVRIDIPGKQPELRKIRVSRAEARLPETEAKAIEARYLRGRLIEFTQHFGIPGQTADEVAAEFEKTRKELTTRHGRLIANQQDRSVTDQFATRTRAYHREPVRGLFLLIAFTEVEDLLRKSKDASFSIIYRNDNLRLRIEAEPQPPPPDLPAGP